MRVFKRSPGYAIVAVLTLALGIGATTAVFSVTSSVLLKPLPFHEPDRLVMVMSTSGHSDPTTVSYPDFDDLQRNQTAFANVAFIHGDGAKMRGVEDPRRLLVGMVSDDFFAVLGMRPAMGRVLTDADNRPGAPPVAVLSNGMWIRDFGAARNVVGRTVDLDKGTFTIVGVVGPGQNYPEWIPGMPTDLYVPIAAVPSALHGILSQRGSHTDARTIARLAPGLTAVQAEQRLRTVADRLAAAYPATDAALAFSTVPLRRLIVGDIGPSLVLLTGAVILVLLLACADVANLALVRAVGRSREIAVRAALGASHGRIVGSLLKESAVLAVAGGILGVGLASIGVRVFVHVAPITIPRLDEIGIDWRALLAALVATSAAAVLSALAPIAVTRRRELLPALKSGGRGGGVDRRGLRLRGSIVTVQVALSLMLVTGAVLLVKSFALLRHVDPGYDPTHLIQYGYAVPASHDDSASRIAHRDRLDAALRVPGVQAVAFANHTPLEPGATFTQVGPDNRDVKQDTLGAVYEVITPGYFAVMRTPLVRGREFTGPDMTSGAVPAIVSATAARRYWPNQDPIGREMTVLNAIHYGNPDFGKPIHTTVIGVAADVKKFSLDEDPYPVVYLPASHPVPSGSAALVRTTVPAATVVPALRRAVAALGPDFAASFEIETDRIAAGLGQRRFIMSLLGLVSCAALVLAALGLYGVISYSVVQRTPELGIRQALGARAADIVILVARGAGTLVLAGLALGICGALALAHTMRALLYGVSPTDATTLMIAVAILAGVAALASYIPARRAGRVDPVVALRAE
jgi:putative ABC transport system permease protein